MEAQVQSTDIPVAKQNDDMKKQMYLAKLNSLVLEQCKYFRSNFADSNDKLDIKAVIISS